MYSNFRCLVCETKAKLSHGISKKEHDPRQHCDKYMCNPKLKLHCRS